MGGCGRFVEWFVNPAYDRTGSPALTLELQSNTILLQHVFVSFVWVETTFQSRERPSSF